jgi:hypothetical protein
MRQVLAMVALAVPALAVAAGCTVHYTAPQAGMTRHGGTAQAIRPPAVTSVPCTAAELTGRLGPVNLGAGQYNQYVVFTNTGRRDCMLSGAPSEVTGVRRDGHKVRLATGVALGMDPGFGLLPGPAKLRPGQSAQIVIHTTTLCGKALAGQAEDFIVLDVGIARSGEVQVDFPHGRPYDAICGIGVSTFGIPRRGF